MHVPHNDKNLNISYHVDFYGPSMSCNLADEITTDNVKRGARTAALRSGIGVKIFSFAPGAGFNETGNTSFYDFTEEEIHFVDTISTDVSRLYVLFPSRLDDNATLYSCEFYNATYKTEFDLFTDGAQEVRAVTENLNPIVFKDFFYTLDIDNDAVSPQDAVKRNYLGVGIDYSTRSTGFYYSAMIANSSGVPTYSNTSSFTFQPMQSQAIIQQIYIHPNPTFADSWPQPESQEQVLKDFEDRFKNLTISAHYGFNPTNLNLPQAHFDTFLSNITTNATVSMRQTQYKYTPLDLLLPYGLSVLFAFVCILMGVYAILMGNASFSNDFSTVLRFVQSMSQLKLKDEKHVAQPLPKHFKYVILEYGKLAPHGNGQASP